VWEVRSDLASRGAVAEGTTPLVIFCVTGALQSIEIKCDTFSVSCDTCSLKTLNKSGVLVGPAGLEYFCRIADQVWVKVWGS
jgi:hypothetical protein